MIDKSGINECIRASKESLERNPPEDIGRKSFFELKIHVCQELLGNEAITADEIKDRIMSSGITRLLQPNGFQEPDSLIRNVLHRYRDRFVHEAAPTQHSTSDPDLDQVDEWIKTYTLSDEGRAQALASILGKLPALVQELRTRRSVMKTHGI